MVEENNMDQFRAERGREPLLVVHKRISNDVKATSQNGLFTDVDRA